MGAVIRMGWVSHGSVITPGYGQKTRITRLWGRFHVAMSNLGQEAANRDECYKSDKIYDEQGGSLNRHESMAND